MNIDIPATIGAVKRALETIARDGREAWRLTATRTFETDVGDAWDALTNPERIPRWFLPVEGDLRLGGRYRLEGNASGEITGCEPPHRLELTWEMGGDVSWVSVTLTEDGDATQLVLEHVAHMPEEHWEQFGPGGTGVGWELALMALGQHLPTGEALDPQEAEAWLCSDAGRPLVAGCSDGWARASIAAGTERGRAEAAAARVTAFYTGTEPPSD